MPSISSRWLRGLAAGLGGTATMAATTLAESVLLERDGPVDYDDSLVLMELAERVVPIDPSPSTERVVNQGMRFGYGSAAGLLRAALDDHLRLPALMIFGSTWVGEAAMLWTLGAAPPPWHWKRDVLVSSLVQHGIYALSTDVAYRALTPRQTHVQEHNSGQQENAAPQQSAADQ